MDEDLSAALPPSSSPLYADVIVPRHLAGFFTYIIPPQLRTSLKVGHCVLVPLGPSRVQGAVISLSQSAPAGLDRKRLRAIIGLAGDDDSQEIPRQALRLAEWVARHYVAPLGQCLRLAMPPGGHKTPDNQKLLLTNLGRAVLSQGQESGEVLSLLKRLSRRPAGIRCRTLLNGRSASKAVLIDRLLEKRWIAETVLGPSAIVDHIEGNPSARGSRSLGGGAPRQVVDWPEFASRLAEATGSRHGFRILVQAPWDTRLALLVDAIHRTIASGRSVLVLAGEGERARWLANNLVQAGICVSACLHQHMSGTVKAGLWRRACAHDPQVVVGTRSAVFVPVSSLGMIWIERAEDHAFKEPKEPRYHASDVAWYRVQDEGGLLVLSSSAPFLGAVRCDGPEGETLHCAVPVDLRPRIEVVDLRLLGTKTILSQSLIEAIRQAVDRQGRVVLFLNRKGYATALICHDCGRVPCCPSCRVALAYHRHTGRLSCSYCGVAEALPRTCASCNGFRLHLIGEGTERVEEEVKRLFPGATVLRVDGETTGKISQAAALWKSIETGQWDILVGTRAMLRDYVVSSVDLVAAVQADTSLSLPDFRAAERTYHLLCEAASLARPAGEGGRVIIQSYLPSHHAIRAIVDQNESLFTAEELAQRIALGYPPAVHLIALYVSGPKENLVQEAAMEWARRLQSHLLSSVASSGADDQPSGANRYAESAVMGPVPPPIPKLRGRFRRQILVKSPVRDAGILAVRKTIGPLERDYPAHMVKFDIDVDPLEMW
jgi:primosomal protein N' (replication factor Y)